MNIQNQIITFCFVIFLVTCSKETTQSNIKGEYPEQTNNVSIDDTETEKPEGAFYAVETKIHDSYDDYITKQSSYYVIEDELKYYSENYTKDIFVPGSFNSFTLIANKMFLTQSIPGYEDVPEHTAIEVYDINLEEKGKFTYISFDYNGKLLRSDIQHGYKRYLIIYGNNTRVSLYDQNNRMVYLASSLRYTFLSDFNVLASSELQENDIIYSVENCINENELLPWVENSSGDGTGEYITFIPQHEIIFSNIPIVISNGFIEYDRNYLYAYNNRIKKIRVHNIDKNEHLDFSIDDTPNYQVIWVGFEKQVNKIKVEILEVYQGERYNDLCINLLKPYSF